MRKFFSRLFRRAVGTLALGSFRSAHMQGLDVQVSISADGRNTDSVTERTFAAALQVREGLTDEDRKVFDAWFANDRDERWPTKAAFAEEFGFEPAALSKRLKGYRALIAAAMAPAPDVQWFLHYLSAPENASQEAYAVTMTDPTFRDRIRALERKHCPEEGSILLEVRRPLPCWFFTSHDLREGLQLSEEEFDEFEDRMDFDPDTVIDITERMERRELDELNRYESAQDFSRLRLLLNPGGVDCMWAHMVLKHDDLRNYYTTTPFPKEWYA